MNELTKNELMNKAATALRKAAIHVEAKQYVLSNPKVYQVLKKAAERYIGGETLLETHGKVKHQNNSGFKCSVEFMGESTTTEHEANEARNEFIRICQLIRAEKLNSTISLDLSHIGLAISETLAYGNLKLICEEASKGNIEVIISAEDCERTDAILSVYKKIQPVYQYVGITLQAYLYRTQNDFEEMLKLNGRIRIVKGAFETPAGLSIPRGAFLDEVYMGYVDRLLRGEHLCSIATHHHQIQQDAKMLIQKYNINKKLYEFESLYGIQSEQLQTLKEEGYPTKVYFVYGKEWYLYLCNRLAEYPMHVFQALIDVMDA